MGWLFSIRVLNCFLSAGVFVCGIESKLDSCGNGMVHDAGGILWRGLSRFSRFWFLQEA